MKFSLSLISVAFALLCLGCASPSNRISKDEALFNSYTPDERRSIRMGQVDIGFDQDQVRMALGEPSRRASTTSAGGIKETWEYRELRPSLGLSGGAGTSGGGVRLGTGVGVRVDPDRTRLLKRVSFDPQTRRVIAVQSFE